MGQAAWSEQMDGATQILVEHGLPRRLESQLGFIGRAIKGGFHGRGQGEPGHGIETPVQQSGIDGLGQAPGGEIELNKDHIAGRERRGPGRGQSPQQHIGVFFKLQRRQHSSCPFPAR